MLIFLDESGTDHNEAPYEVLAGVAIRERNLWNLIQAIRSSERNHFGTTLSSVGVEFKGKKLLKSKVFRLAAQGDEIAPEQRTPLVYRFLQKGLHAEEGESQSFQRQEFTAYGQAALAFVREMFGICAQLGMRVFASIVALDAPIPKGGFLRKDYAYLFERFFYYLEDISPDEMGLVVFDERERALCKQLLGQMENYFLATAPGRARSVRIVPEPFFVHSDLTTAVQIADIVAYCLNWGWRLNRMERPVRPEMKPFAELAFSLRYIGQRPSDAGDHIWPVYGVTYIDDLRPKEERF